MAKECGDLVMLTASFLTIPEILALGVTAHVMGALMCLRGFCFNKKLTRRFMSNVGVMWTKKIMNLTETEPSRLCHYLEKYPAETVVVQPTDKSWLWIARSTSSVMRELRFAGKPLVATDFTWKQNTQILLEQRSHTLPKLETWDMQDMVQTEVAADRVVQRFLPRLSHSPIATVILSAGTGAAAVDSVLELKSTLRTLDISRCWRITPEELAAKVIRVFINLELLVPQCHAKAWSNLLAGAGHIIVHGVQDEGRIVEAPIAM
jgi:hypothetical protein